MRIQFIGLPILAILRGPLTRLRSDFGREDSHLDSAEDSPRRAESPSIVDCNRHGDDYSGTRCWPRADHRGRGYEHFGLMSVSEEARRYLGAQGIHVREARTRQAVADFNQLKTQRARVVAALHLTC